MRKIITALLILSVMFICLMGSSFAESFTLHSGVTFGMSVSEVEALEKAAGFSMNAIDVYGTSKVSSIKGIEGKIAGIEKSEIHYMFDKDGKFFAATYWLGNAFDDLEPSYSTIETALEGKYGEPSDAWLLVANRIGYAPNDYKTNWGLSPNGKVALPTYNSWLVKLDDGNYVVIVHYKETVSISGLSLKPNFHIVGYQWYSAEEISNELNDISDEADENQSQRDNDL